MESTPEQILSRNQTSLFNESDRPLLHRDGVVEYTPALFSCTESEDLFNELLATTPWQEDEVVLSSTKGATSSLCGSTTRFLIRDRIRSITWPIKASVSMARASGSGIPRWRA